MKKFIKMMALTAAAIGMSAGAAVAEPLKVGFLYLTTPGDHGWTYAHELARQEVQAHFGDKVETTFVENVPEGPDAERVVRELARQGNQVIFGTSFGYMDPMVAAASKDKSNTIFMHGTGYKVIDGKLDNYNCRLYQARYLTGVAAGMLTKTNKIGSVGSHPIPEIISNINAATLGAQSVNPNIEVNVIWINSWFDPPKDMDAAKTVKEWGADVLFTTTDSPNVVTLAQKESTPAKPLWSMGNDAPLNSFGPDRYATGAMFNWNLFYKSVMDSVAAGTWKVNRSFWGLKENCVGLSPWGKNVPGEVVNKVETIKMDWINDKMGTYYPFDQGVTKQDGSKIEAGVLARPELETII